MVLNKLVIIPRELPKSYTDVVLVRTQKPSNEIDRPNLVTL